jgi:hypothetical protein
MAKGKSLTIGPLAMAPLLLAACQSIPGYNETLDWFSWSEYDPEIRAIEDETSPPGALEAPATTSSDGAFVRDDHGSYVQTEPPRGMIVFLGATPFVSATAADSSVSLADASGGSDTAHRPLVGIRSSVGGSVTWRSPRGQP